MKQRRVALSFLLALLRFAAPEVLRGDDRAFEAFVTRHEAWLLRYARALGGVEQAEGTFLRSKMPGCFWI